MNRFSFRSFTEGRDAVSASFLKSRKTLLCAAITAAVFAASLPAFCQAVNLFPKDYQDQWTRTEMTPKEPLTNIPQWHIDAARGVIVCDGNGGHDWLRFNKELHNFDFHVKWRFTKVDGPQKYNSGVFFRNSKDAAIWNQAQTTPEGGYLFGTTLIDGKSQFYNLSKEMKENRIKPAGEWNVYDIHCVGDTCTLAVNGMVVNTVKMGAEKGYIGLESEGYKIEFADFKVTELK
jgi:hypothetical protein